MKELAIEFVKSAFFGAIVGGSIGALVTHWLSRRRFIQERWWDRKADAYAGIMENLVSLKHSLERWMASVAAEEDARSGEVLPDEKIHTIKQEYEKTRLRTEQAAIEGNYIISEEAGEILERLIKELRRDPAQDVYPDGPPLPRYQYFVHENEAVRKCLRELREEAHSDLKAGVFKGLV